MSYDPVKWNSWACILSAQKEHCCLDIALTMLLSPFQKWLIFHNMMGRFKETKLAFCKNPILIILPSYQCHNWYEGNKLFLCCKLQSRWGTHSVEYSGYMSQLCRCPNLLKPWTHQWVAQANQRWRSVVKEGSAARPKSNFDAVG